jgi:hypothetical protein
MRSAGAGIFVSSTSFNTVSVTRYVPKDKRLAGARRIAADEAGRTISD